MIISEDIIMAMTDITFILIFLPIALLTLAFKPHYQKYVLLFLSLFYYACGSPEYFVLLLAMLMINVALAYVIHKNTGGGIFFSSSYSWYFVECRNTVLL